MLRLVIANKVYSSWSLRGWLAVMQSGLPFEEILIPMGTPEFEAAQQDPAYMPGGKVPALHEGDVAVWESLAIIDWLDARTGGTRFWPQDLAARAFALSMASEMHAGFTALRRDCPMNLRIALQNYPLSAEVRADVARIDHLWATARTCYGAGGDYLFGSFGAADIMFSAVATRFVSYGIILPSAAAQSYCATLVAHPWMRAWHEAALQEPWRRAHTDALAEQHQA